MPAPRLAALVALALAAGCDSAPLPPPPPDPVPVTVTAMSRSLGRGADLGRLAGDAPATVRAFELYGVIDASRTAVRIETLADEIVDADPDVVGLQEVLTVRTQYPSDGAPGGTPNADEVRVDALAGLQEALAARGAAYRVAAEAELWDRELRAARAGGPVFDLRLTERAVVLVRDTLAALALPGVAEAGAPLGAGTELRAPAGSAAARVTLGEAAVTVVSARFDARPDAARAQAERLVAGFDPLVPAVVLGGVAGADGEARAAVTAAGFIDVWAQLRADAPGPTCCIGEALGNASATLDARTDAVWLRGLNGEAVTRTGTDAPAPTALWPSDRAGVVARASRAGV